MDNSESVSYSAIIFEERIKFLGDILFVRQSFCVISAFALFSACESTLGEPRGSIDKSRDFEAAIINGSLSEANLAAGVSFTASKEQRDRLIYARMAEIDVLYFEYERRVSVDIRKSNFGFNLAGILVGTAGTLVGEQGSQNLSAISSILSGGKAAYDKDVLLDQTVQAFTSQMRANRAAVKERIVNKLSFGNAAYPIQAALSDLAEYQQAGTLASALAGITETAQQQQSENEESLDKAEDLVLFRSTQASPTSTSRSLTSVPPSVVKQCLDRVDKPEADVPDNATQFLLEAGNFPRTEQNILACLRTDFGITISPGN